MSAQWIVVPGGHFCADPHQGASGWARGDLDYRLVVGALVVIEGMLGRLGESVQGGKMAGQAGLQALDRFFDDYFGLGERFFGRTVLRLKPRSDEQREDGRYAG